MKISDFLSPALTDQMSANDPKRTCFLESQFSILTLAILAVLPSVI
jgi:hypothetical protein